MLSASELANRLARDAEAVCRHYLSAGRRAGNYWIVGDTANSKGKSLYVHLSGPRAGRWADAATAEYGDLLDLVRETCGLIDFRDVADEARRFLSLPQPAPAASRRGDARTDPPVERPADERAQRLFRMTQPLAGTLADSYLRQRGILRASLHPALRYHPSCYYRDLVTGRTHRFPALIAAVTDPAGTITGVHRTWLDPDGFSEARLGRAPIETPRRAMGDLLGNAVRFGMGCDVMTAGEGIETVMSVRSVLPRMPAQAALSAAHLSAILFPATLRRLYIARDNDPAGDGAMATLIERANAAGIEAVVVSPSLGDFNEDLRLAGLDSLRAAARVQIAPQDVARFMALAA